jgi:heme-degrading monooxygenase HmoA
MIVILFRSKLTATAGDDYARMAAEMDTHARTFPGFVDVKAFNAADGERLTVVWWLDEPTLRAWATDVRHLAAQRAGRERWYEYYKIEVAHIVRVHQFERSHEAVAGPSAPGSSC